jgi:hypothetical protein
MNDNIFWKKKCVCFSPLQQGWRGARGEEVFKEEKGSVDYFFYFLIPDPSPTSSKKGERELIL